MGKKSTSKNTQVGRTVVKARENLPSAKRKKNKLDAAKQPTGDVNCVVENDEQNTKNLFSITEQNDLEEFMTKAQLAGTEFTAQRMNVSIVEASCNRLVGVAAAKIDEDRILQCQEKYKHYLTVPRRPAWNRQMSAEQLQNLETESFLQWRRKLAELEEVEQLMLTPFERNLEIWRQLWRVVDRSDVIVQILDARDPLLFRNEDLEQYVEEISSTESHVENESSKQMRKINVLLLNKADYLTPKQRQIWCEYFNARKIRAVFWSAIDLDDEGVGKTLASLCIEEEEEDELGRLDEKESLPGKSDDAQNEDSFVESEEIDAESSEYETVEGDSEEEDEDEPETEKLASQQGTSLNSPDLLTREKLLEYLKSLEAELSGICGDIFTVGMVGYPNVGKSSTINKLMQRKKVAVSATPGKTKHFQTLLIDGSHMMLCDCPGLVMPSFAMSREQMLLSAILSPDQMRDFEPPIALLCRKVPKRVLQHVYGLTFPRKDENSDDSDFSTDPRELMTLYAFSRGFMSPKGLPDCSRAARALVKDFISGKLRYCQAPPGEEQAEFNDWTFVDSGAATGFSQNNVFSETLKTLQRRHLVDDQGGTATQVDKAFFGPRSSVAHVQSSKLQILVEGGGKPPKKLNRNKKKDKLRRVYRDLDA